MSHSTLAPVPTHRAVVTGNKRPFRYIETLFDRPPALDRELVKARLGIDPLNTSFDSLIDLLIKGVTVFAEQYTGLTFIRQVYVTTRDFFTSSFELRRAPLSTISSVQYTDNNGVVKVIPATVYAVTTEADYRRLILRPGQSWPGDKIDANDSVRIDFSASMGNTFSNLPGDISMALLAHTVSAFTKAGDCCDEAKIPSIALNVYKQRRILSLKIVHSEG